MLLLKAVIAAHKVMFQNLVKNTATHATCAKKNIPLPVTLIAKLVDHHQENIGCSNW